MPATPGEIQSQLQGEAPKDTSVTLSVNEASIAFVAIDGSGKEIGSVVMSRDEYRDSDFSDIRKKLFGSRKAASGEDRKNEASNGEETAAGRTAAKLGIQESVLRLKANQDPIEAADKKETAEKGVTNKRIEAETGKDLPKPPEKPHDTSARTPNPADNVGEDRSPTVHDKDGKTTPSNPGTITHDFQLNQDPRKAGDPQRKDGKNG